MFSSKNVYISDYSVSKNLSQSKHSEQLLIFDYYPVTMKPLVSVIVIAHDRKKFLPFALNSLKSQDVDKRLFEVILVKNYDDIEIDNIARKEGFHCVRTDLKTASEKLLLGYRISVGNIVSFLEDDDLYSPSKINRLIDISNSK